MCLCVAAPSAAAATLQVTNDGDSGTGSLRAALAQAQDGDTITFPSAPMAITLASPLELTTGADIEGCSADPNAASVCVTIAGSSDFDGLDVTGDGATVHGLEITGAAIGIDVSGSNVAIGGPSPATMNVISASAGPAIQVDGSATSVDVEGDTGEGNGAAFLDVAAGANGGAQPPTIVAASSTAVVGLAPARALVRVLAAPAQGSVDSVAGTATADQNGVWALPDSVGAGETLTATETGGSGTSGLSPPTSAVVGVSTPPTTTITGATGTVNTATPTFALSSSDPDAVLLCRLGSAAYQPCSPSFTPGSALSEGAHTLYARSAGAGGLGQEVSDAIDVDLAHAGSITAGPRRFGRASSVVFRFSVPAGTARSACAFDDGGYVPCSRRFASGHMLDGRHVFHLRTTDAAGQTAVLDTVFTIDTLAPQVALGHTRLRIGADGSVVLAVYCPASEPGGCSGSVGLASVPARRPHKLREIGASGWHGGPNTTERVSVAVPAWAIRRSQLGRGLPVNVVVVARDDAGNVRVLRDKGTLLAPLPTRGDGRP